MMQKSRFYWMLLLGLCAGLAAADAVPDSGNNPPPGPPPPPRVRMRRGPGGDMYWRVFNRMGREERRAMMELQAKDPAAFQQKMKQLAEALRKADEELRQKIETLAQRCRTGSDAEKAAAREELARIFREGYQRRLEDSRRHLQEMQRRIRKLEESLKRKEADKEKEIREMVENCIQGRKPQDPARFGPRPPMGPSPVNMDEKNFPEKTGKK